MGDFGECLELWISLQLASLVVNVVVEHSEVTADLSLVQTAYPL